MQDRLGNAPEGTPFTGTEWGHLRAESRRWVIQAVEVMRQAAFAALASSRNSSRPPSSDSLRARADREKRRPSGRRPGGQPGHPARRWVLSETPDSIVDLYPERCRRCDAELSKRDAVDKPVRHQVVEIKDFGHHVTEYRRHRCRCGRCRTRTTAELPIGVPAGLMGTKLLAFMALLVAIFRASRRRIRDFMSAAFGIELSVGLVDKGLKRVSNSLAQPVEEARERRKKSGVSYVDDTGWFEKNRASHVWVNDTGDVVLYQITPSRDTVSAKAVIGEDFVGEVVSDRAGSFNWFPTERRQVCWAHLKRQFQGIADKAGAGRRIGREGVELSNRLFAIWHKYKAGEISREQMQRRMRKVEIDAGGLLEEGAWCTDATVSRFCKNLLALGPALFGFSREAGVEPTNNTAERDLRPAVIWRKLSFGTQSSWGSRLVERLLTVVSTLKRQGRSVLEFFQQSLSAKDRGTAPPSLLPGKSRDQPVRA